MKKCLILLILVLLLCSCGKKKEEDEYKVGTSNKIKDELAFEVTIQQINIREEPNTTSDIIGIVKEGSKFIIIDYTSDENYIWFHIKTKNKIEGYVASSIEEPYVEILNGDVDIEPPVLRLLDTNIKVKNHNEITVEKLKDKYIEFSDNSGKVDVKLEIDYSLKVGDRQYALNITATDPSGNETSKRAYLYVTNEKRLSNDTWGTYDDVLNIRKKFQNICEKNANFRNSICFKDNAWELDSNGGITIFNGSNYCDYKYKDKIEPVGCFDDYSSVEYEVYKDKIKENEELYLPVIKKIIDEYLKTGYEFSDMIWQ